MTPGNKVFLIAALAMLLLAEGCAVRKQVVEPLTFPEIGTVATRGVGENLVTKGIGISEPALVIPRDELLGTFTLVKGEYAFNSENSTIINFGTATSGGKQATIFLDKAQRTICAGRGQCASINHTVEYRLTRKAVNSFQQTLLYNGKIGNRITLAYREFSAGLARPAFNNEVAYDLSESSVLGYKGARIEVIKATNTEITYKVLSGFE